MLHVVGTIAMYYNSTHYSPLNHCLLIFVIHIHLLGRLFLLTVRMLDHFLSYINLSDCSIEVT